MSVQLTFYSAIINHPENSVECLCYFHCVSFSFSFSLFRIRGITLISRWIKCNWFGMSEHCVYYFNLMFCFLLCQNQVKYFWEFRSSKRKISTVQHKCDWNVDMRWFFPISTFQLQHDFIDSMTEFIQHNCILYWKLHFFWCFCIKYHYLCLSRKRKSHNQSDNILLIAFSME